MTPRSRGVAPTEIEEVNSVLPSLDDYREDLVHQLSIPDELDWDYFVEIAIKAKIAADHESRNCSDRGREIKLVAMDDPLSLLEKACCEASSLEAPGR